MAVLVEHPQVPQPFIVPNFLQNEFTTNLRPETFPVNWYTHHNSHGYNLVQLAIREGDDSLLECCLSKMNQDDFPTGNQEYTYGNTLYQIIISTNHKTLLPCIEKYPQLLQKEALVRLQLPETRKRSALHYAAEHKLCSIFKVLIQHDEETLRMYLCNKENVDANHDTPLHIALRQGTDEIITLLLPLCGLLWPNKRGHNILHLAVSSASPNKDILTQILRLDKAEDLLNATQPAISPLHEAFSRYVLLNNQLKGEGKGQRPSIGQSPDRVTPIITLLRFIYQRDDPAGNLKKLLRATVHLLSEIKEQGWEFYFDMGSFNSIPRFRKYLTSLESLRRLDIKYHLALHHVTLPNLECSQSPDHCELSACQGFIPGLPGPKEDDHKPRNQVGVMCINRSEFEASRVFEFLKQRGVCHVETVTVPDCRRHPHPDREIAKALNGLSVRVLKWRKLDPDPTVFKDINELKVLHLYSSGNECVLKYWTSPNILGFLLSLENVVVTLSIVDLIHSHGTSNKIELEQFRKEWQDTFNHSSSPNIIASLPPKPTIQLEIEEIEKPFGEVITIIEAAQLRMLDHRVFTHMRASFNGINQLFTLHELRRKNIERNPIRVAIIDSGVEMSHLLEELEPYGLDYRPVGRSFVQSCPKNGQSSDTHWHSPINSHGTKLAHLIYRWNKYCKFFIAKVSDGSKRSVQIGAAIEALKWAKEENVDIICMSWSVDERELDPSQRQKFPEAVKDAAATSLVFCSTHDQGRFCAASCPANLSETISITSYNAEPTPENFSELNPKSFYFPAEGIPLDSLPAYLQRDSNAVEYAQGSSFATALAVGFASFILSCVKLAYYPVKSFKPKDGKDPDFVKQAMKEFKRHGKMTDLLRELATDNEKRYVHPWALLEDTVQEDADYEDVDKLKQHFVVKYGGPKL